MGVQYDSALGTLDKAVQELFTDPRVRSVGIGAHMDGYGYHVVRNATVPMPLNLAPPPLAIKQIPVTFVDRDRDIEAELRVPSKGPGSPGAASMVPEQLSHRPLVCGLQIQNYDDDVRTGAIGDGHIVIGTLGCFVELQDGSIAMLSNNHVVAGENRGRRGSDAILQPGSLTASPAQHVATLTDFVALKASPPGASPITGTAVFNDVDAGVATVDPGLHYRQGHLPARPVPAPSGTATVTSNDHVYKVGRTTGLTFGVVTTVATVVGPVGYSAGPCWFRRSIAVQGLNGTMFSDRGDSGSAVLKVGTGQVIGILYAGNGTDTYVCPIDDVLSGLACSLV